MRPVIKHIAIPTAALALAVGSGRTEAWGLPVYDAANLAANELILAANSAQIAELAIISFQLKDKTKGTINYNTTNIDNSTRSIDKSTQNIDKSTQNIDNSTHNIDTTTVGILNYTEKNYAIDNDFTWIINKNGENEVIPIPRDLADKLDAVKGDAGNADAYAAKFHDAATYAERMLPASDEIAFEGSRARKAANDTVVKSIELQQEDLIDESTALKDLREISMKAQGTGHQLQVANALSGAQINQMMKMRSMMLAAEASRAAEAQAAADKDAQALATARHMRAGLASALNQASRVASAQ